MLILKSLKRLEWGRICIRTEMHSNDSRLLIGPAVFSSCLQTCVSLLTISPGTIPGLGGTEGFNREADSVQVDRKRGLRLANQNILEFSTNLQPQTVWALTGCHWAVFVQPGTHSAYTVISRQHTSSPQHIDFLCRSLCLSFCLVCLSVCVFL